jgi:hypothetical protein
LLVVRPQQAVALLLGSSDAGQGSLKVQRQPVLHIDSDRLQGLSYQGERYVTRRGRWRASRTRWSFSPFAALRGIIGRRGVLNLVLERNAPRLQQVVAGLIALTLVQISALIAAKLAGARSAGRRVDLVVALSIPCGSTVLF